VFGCTTSCSVVEKMEGGPALFLGVFPLRFLVKMGQNSGHVGQIFLPYIKMDEELRRARARALLDGGNVLEPPVVQCVLTHLRSLGRQWSGASFAST